ncbi:MAG: flagellar hook-length control protein FliK [Pseudomonadota bacterium]|nr:flagellar hook-length control protein FliK [Pseudomonadota bacterium]
MQQAILPQLNAPSAQPEPGPKRPAASQKDADSRSYDEVSREEASRTENRREPEQRPDTGANTRPEEARAENAARNQSEKAGKASADSASEAVTSENGGKAAESLADAPTEGAALTFANLQSLLTPLNVAQADAGELLMPSVMTGNGANGLFNGTKTGAGVQALLMGLTPAGETADGKSLPLGTRLSELLSANVTTESGRAIDLVSSNGAPRFQTTLELAAQQTPQAAKLAAETAVPLRGYATSVDVPVGQAEWGDKVMGKLSWLTARNMSVAEIHLTPPDMGPMEVKVRVQNDQANITVHAANPVVREQLEQHSHRLRDMLGDQGLALGQFDVSDQPGQQASEQGADGDGGRRAGGHGAESLLAETDEVVTGSGQLDLGWRGEVDVFA